MQKFKRFLFILLGFLGLGLSSDWARAQSPGIMNFQVVVKNPSGQLVTTALPVSVRAQYLARDLANTKWCALYEEGFAATITNGVLNLRLGDGTRLGPGVTPISGIGNTSAELLIEDSSVNEASRMASILSLSQITFQTRCILGNTISAPFSSWVTEASTLDLLPSARALRLHIVLPGNMSVTPGFSLNALPFAVSSKKAEKLTGSMGAVPGQILKWNGTDWVPDSLTGGDYTAGTGIIIDPVGRTIEINPAEIPASPIADGSVTEVKLADDAVTTVKILNGSITSDKIQDAAVTDAKLADNAVVTSKILDGAVTDAKIDEVSWSKVATTPTTLAGYGITDAALATDLNNYVLKAGDTMTGALNLPTNGLTVGTNQLTVSATGVGVGIATPTPSSVLDINSTIGGLLIPRLTTAQRDAIVAPAAGLQIYNTTTQEINYYNGVSWQALGVAGSGIASLNALTGSAQTLVTGDSGTDFTINSLGSTHTFNLPSASAVNRGLLTSADFSNFASKLDSALPSGQILIGDGTNQAAPQTLSGDATLANTGALTLADSGVTPGTYGMVTVDSKGRVTVGEALEAGDIPNIDASKITSGVLPVARGGTNSGAPLTNNRVMISLGDAIVEGSGSATTKSPNTFVMRDGSGNIQGTLGQFDQIALDGSVSGAVTLQSPAAPTSYSLTFPPSAGSAGQVLSTDGSGVTSWIEALTSATAFINNGSSFGGVATLGTNDNFALQFETNNTVRMTLTNDGKLGVGTPIPAVSLDVAGAIKVASEVSACGPSLVGSLRLNGTVLEFCNSTDWVVLATGGSTISGSGTTNTLARFTASGTIGNSGISDDGTVITATRSFAAITNPIASGATINLATSNTFTLASLGGSVITVSNPTDGAIYNIIIEDTVSRTYTFSGCTNSFFKPANGPTLVDTRTVYGLMTIQKGANWDCYITWSTGFEP